MAEISDRPVVFVAVAVIAILVIGEVIVYTSDSSDYGAEMTMDDGIIEYDLSSRGSKVFDIVVNDNNGYGSVQKLYLYLDTGYASNYGVDEADVGAAPTDQEYYLEQLVQLLEYRSDIETEFVDAAGLREVIDEGVASGDCSRVGLVVVSGALPDTVYTGNQEDIVFDWISLGGTMYWAGGMIGAYYATMEDVHPVSDYQALFFGSDCLNTGDTTKAYSVVGSNDYTSVLSLSNNDVTYAVSQEVLPEGTPSLAIGYQEDGYSSITLVGSGSGAIVVFGGQLGNFQRYDMAQVIASGIGPSSEIVEYVHGTVSGSASGEIEVGDVGVTVYVYLGGYYPVFGKGFQF